MATYNGGRFLREQLDSLYCQTLQPDEVIVCDDCSSDNTTIILEEYHKKYGLIYYVNEKSLGVNKNFFKAISLCSGDYICICDQDDIWLPHKIETLYKAIKEYDNSQCNCVSSQVIDINAKGEQLRNKKLLPDTEGWKETLLTQGRSQGCTMIMNKKLKDRAIQLYHSHSIADSMLYDGFFAFVAAIEGNKKNLGVPLMYYRHHDSNVIGKISTRRRTIAEKFRNLPKYYPLVSDLRLKNLAIMYSVYKDENISNDIKCFLEKMDKLSTNSSVYTGFKLVCSLPVPILLKIRTCLCTPISIVSKRICGIEL